MKKKASTSKSRAVELLTRNTSVLKDTRCYLIGSMQYSDGRGWREKVKTTFKTSGIKFYDPYHKPFVNDIPEDEAARADMLH
jgi:hypothetical protein